MNHIFDTHTAFRVLTDAGIEPKQGEAIVNVMTKALDMDVLATKADIERQTQALTIRFGGMLVVAVGALGAVIKLI